MATLKQRLHRKNSSGTYDTVYFETSADCITGTLGIAHGGTGATTAANARSTLGITPANIGAAASSHTHTISQISSLQSEINYLKTSVSNGKIAVASAITDKGVSTSATADFNTMANNIRSIPSGSSMLNSSIFKNAKNISELTSENIPGKINNHMIIFTMGSVERYKYDFYMANIGEKFIFRRSVAWSSISSNKTISEVSPMVNIVAMSTANVNLTINMSNMTVTWSSMESNISSLTRSYFCAWYIEI